MVNLLLITYVISWLQKCIPEILTKQDVLAEKQETLVEKQEELAEKQETLIEKQEALKLKPIASGSLTATGAENTVVEYEENETFKVQGWINLKNMVAGDTVTIRQYFQTSLETELTLFAQRTYKGVQSQPLIHVTPREILKKVKVTLQQTSGTLKTFPYEFYIGKTS